MTIKPSRRGFIKAGSAATRLAFLKFKGPLGGNREGTLMEKVEEEVAGIYAK